MASTANVQKSNFGNLKVTYGDWSSTAGDAAMTIGVEGGRVYLCEFTSQDGNTNPQTPWSLAESTSGTAGVVTITVYNQGTVTSGRFLIIHS